MDNTAWGERHVRAFRSHFAMNGVSVYPMLKRDGDGRYFVKSLEWERGKETASVVDEPLCFHLDTTAAQELMDDLWNCGIRPTEGAGSAGQSQAQQNHIKDLEKVSDRLLGLLERR